MSELSEAISEMRNMRESYDQIGAAAEAYNTGKTELAANITAKGIPASASETLPELAEKVGAIAQTQTILEGGDMYEAQLFGDGALWNLYQVLADMKTRFMGNGDYAALIVCEYYKGYDSLQLQGADAYYTCDGDLYEYASPNHVWHDADNGKANRWVAFLYREEGARLDITNTAISPRSMYIGGHIGTIEYFVNGRLTDIVCGVEETDVVDIFEAGSFTQSFLFNTIIRGVKKFNKIAFTNGGVVVLHGCETLNTGSNSFSAISAYGGSLLEIGGLKKIAGRIYSENTRISLPDTETIDGYTEGVTAALWSVNNSTTQIIYAPKLTELQPSNQGGYIGTGLYLSGAKNIIDVHLGEMTTIVKLSSWNPTNVLADTTKKAQLIENIKNHILARVSDRAGLSQLVFTISTNMYNNIASEQIEWQGETMSLADAFLTKNWLLAGA